MGDEADVLLQVMALGKTSFSKYLDHTLLAAYPGGMEKKVEEFRVPFRDFLEEGLDWPLAPEPEPEAGPAVPAAMLPFQELSASSYPHRQRSEGPAASAEPSPPPDSEADRGPDGGESCGEEFPYLGGSELSSSSSESEDSGHSSLSTLTASGGSTGEVSSGSASPGLDEGSLRSESAPSRSITPEAAVEVGSENQGPASECGGGLSVVGDGGRSGAGEGLSEGDDDGDPALATSQYRLEQQRQQPAVSMSQSGNGGDEDQSASGGLFSDTASKQGERSARRGGHSEGSAPEGSGAEGSGAERAAGGGPSGWEAFLAEGSQGSEETGSGAPHSPRARRRATDGASECSSGDKSVGRRRSRSWRRPTPGSEAGSMDERSSFWTAAGSGDSEDSDAATSAFPPAPYTLWGDAESETAGLAHPDYAVVVTVCAWSMWVNPATLHNAVCELEEEMARVLARFRSTCSGSDSEGETLSEDWSETTETDPDISDLE